MNRDQKAAVIEEVIVQLREAQAVYAVDYRGTSVPQAAELRSKLLGLMKAPASQLVRLLNTPAGQLARVFNAYAMKEAA